MTPFSHLIVTGVPGWFGSRFIELLRQHTDPTWRSMPVKLLVQPSHISAAQVLLAELQCTNTDIIPFDLSVPDANISSAFENAQDALVIHGAGIIHPRSSTQEFTRINVDGTQHILTACARANAKKIVLLSSNSQSGCNPHANHRFTEASPYNPYLGYGRSKMRMEQQSIAFATQHNCDLTMLRPCWFYGPRQPDRQSQFFHLIRRGLFPLPGRGSAMRSLTYVDDICTAALLAATSSVSKSKTYWIADQEPYSLREIVETVCACLKEDFNISISPRILGVPSFLSTLCEIADRGIQSAGRYSQPFHVFGELNKHIACSVVRATTELAFKPSRTLREGMRRSIAWCLEHGQTI